MCHFAAVSLLVRRRRYSLVTVAVLLLLFMAVTTVSLAQEQPPPEHATEKVSAATAASVAGTTSSTSTCPQGQSTLLVKVLTDLFPEETALTLTNVCDKSILLKIAYGDLLKSSKLSQYTFCVEPDAAAYTIKVTDKFDDGMITPGYVQVQLDGQTVFSSGKFFKSTERTFGECPGIPMPSAEPTKSAAPSLQPSEEPSAAPSLSTKEVNCKAAVGEQKFVLHLLTDMFADEISFELKDICNGKTVLQTKTRTLKSRKEYKFTRCVSTYNKYTFNISDASGDGMYTPAFYSLQLDDQVLVNATHNIGYETMTTFGTCVEAPSAAPTSTSQPTQSAYPTRDPTLPPTHKPTFHPTLAPTRKPTATPTHPPTTHKPTHKPTQAPVVAPPPHDGGGGGDPNANCPCNAIKNKIRRNVCRRMYPKRCPA